MFEATFYSIEGNVLDTVKHKEINLKPNMSRSIIINKAVTSHKKDKEISLFFTKAPYCSSTLEPDVNALSGLIISDFFKIKDKKKVPATTLDSVLEDLSLKKIDWLKIDSQGTDLRIFNSIKYAVRSKVLAVDMEPGLIDAYYGEDLFVDVHTDMIRNGFGCQT